MTMATRGALRIADCELRIFRDFDTGEFRIADCESRIWDFELRSSRDLDTCFFVTGLYSLRFFQVHNIRDHAHAIRNSNRHFAIRNPQSEIGNPKS
jgi:hypothetical protein